MANKGKGFQTIRRSETFWPEFGSRSTRKCFWVRGDSKEDFNERRPVSQNSNKLKLFNEHNI